MKTIILSFIIALFTFSCCLAQSGTWTWLRGSNLGNSPGNPGTMGVASATNDPASVYEAAYWIDLQGNLWILGGDNYSNNAVISNRLWKYSPTTNQWTWVRGTGVANYGVKGIPSPTNDPPPNIILGSNCMTDANGDLWLFAGDNNGDDLWKYNIATNQWTWMYGLGNGASTNAPVYGAQGVYGATFGPGFRQECKAGWHYNNALWIFGGYNNGLKNDIWSYDLNTNQWAWQGGGQGSNAWGFYGIKGVPNPANEPPAKECYTKWQDNNAFYIFGGYTFHQFQDTYNDVWKFDKVTKEWTWISGTGYLDDPGTVNLYCAPDINAIPKARYENTTPESTVGSCETSFWTFGGFDSYNDPGNDLWLFNAATLKWTKICGQAPTLTVVPPYSYGTMGVPAASNLPPGRGGQCMWSDINGNLYLFGGLDVTTNKFYNDLWKFVPDTSCFHTALFFPQQLTPPSDSVLCPGDTISMAVPANVTISISPNTGYVYDTAANMIHFFGSTQTTYTVTANYPYPCFGSDTISFTIYSVPSPSPVASLTSSANNTCSTTPVILTSTSTINPGGSTPSYTWNWGGGTASPGGNNPGPHTVSWMNAASCAVSDTVSLSITQDGCTSNTATLPITVYPNPVASFTATPNPVCTGIASVLQFNGVTCASGGAVTYNWNMTGGTVTPSNTNIPGPLAVIWNNSSNTTVTYNPSLTVAQDGCTSNTVTLPITIYPTPTVIITGKNNFCEGDIITLDAGAGYSQYLWSTSAITQTINVSTSGTYTVNITDANACSGTGSQTVYANPNPVANAGADTTIFEGNSIVLNGSNSYGGNQYSWAPTAYLNLPNSATPTATPPANTNFILTYTNTQNGCSSTDTVIISVQNGTNIVVPGAFSPNGDGKNDLFRAIPSGKFSTNGYRFIIYNRWGNEVFATNDSSVGWDGKYMGKDCEIGAYYYYIEALNTSNEKLVFKGNVTLVR